MLTGMPLASTMGLLGSPKKPMVTPGCEPQWPGDHAEGGLQGQGQGRSEGAQADRRRGQGGRRAAHLRDDVPAGDARDVDALLLARVASTPIRRVADHHPAATDGRQHEDRQDGRLLRRRPWNARAIADGIGYTAITTQALWKNHPEKVCAFTRSSPTGTRRRSGGAEALHEASVWADTLENRPELCAIVSAPTYINCPKN